jgi:hypothetical protein
MAGQVTIVSMRLSGHLPKSRKETSQIARAAWRAGLNCNGSRVL